MRPPASPRFLRGVGFVLTLALTLAVTGWPPAAGQEAMESSAPYGVEPYPRSSQVARERDDEVRPRELVLSRVDRIRRELRVQETLRVDASTEWATYLMPDGVSVAEVVQHYRRELGSDLLFSCLGRDCGRSNDWANQIFQQALLYGLDRTQQYAAWEWQGRLVSLYAVERGNGRVYARLQVLDPQNGVGLSANALLGNRLGERGWAIVDDVVPQRDGSFRETARTRLAALAPALEAFSGQDVYLVCHLGGTGAVETLLSASRRCAESAVELIAAAAARGESAALPALHGFGAGPLLPRPGSPVSRLELVVPEALR